MIKEIKRFFLVLLVVEILFIVLIVVPVLTFYFMITYMGLWGILGAIGIMFPWIMAWIDYIRKQA